MRKYSYTLIVDDVSESAQYYHNNLDWEIAKQNENCAFIETRSPLCFSLVNKAFIFRRLHLNEQNVPTMSFSTWFYETESDLLMEMEQLVQKGMSVINGLGHFLQDQEGILWELRVKGELL